MSRKGGGGKTFGGGYGKPPIETRFQKGRSGNPKGRPKKNINRDPLEAVFDKQIDAVIGGKRLSVHFAEALVLKLTESALNGDNNASMRSLLSLLEKLSGTAGEPRHQPITEIVCTILTPGPSLDNVGGLTKIDGVWRIEPWLLETALARRPDILDSEVNRKAIAKGVVDSAHLNELVSRRLK